MIWFGRAEHHGPLKRLPCWLRGPGRPTTTAIKSAFNWSDQNARPYGFDGLDDCCA